MSTTHKWDTSKVASMLIEEEDAASTISSPAILLPYEAERYVEELTKFSLYDVGTEKWIQQHFILEKLNLQAHHCAMSNSDEFVLEAISTFGKFECIIHDLIIIEAWKEHVYPLIAETIAGRNSMRVYFIFYHEATLINLLEMMLYHKYVCESGGERMIELVDYICRKISRLSSGFNFNIKLPADISASSAAELADAISNQNPIDELQQHYRDIEFKICVSSVALGRYICEHAASLPLSVVSRITDTHDMLVMIIPLIENPPWTRRLPNGKWQKLIEQQWTEVQPINLLKVTKLAGQPWLALYHLLAKEVFRERYHLNTFRKGQVLRVRKYINEMMLDQLPFLADIQRYMDELSITEVPEPTSIGSGVFMLQQVAVMSEQLLKGIKWPEVAQHMIREVFTMTDKTDKDLKSLADLYSDDATEGIFDVEK